MTRAPAATNPHRPTHRPTAPRPCPRTPPRTRAPTPPRAQKTRAPPGGWIPPRSRSLPLPGAAGGSRELNRVGGLAYTLRMALVRGLRLGGVAWGVLSEAADRPSRPSGLAKIRHAVGPGVTTQCTRCDLTWSCALSTCSTPFARGARRIVPLRRNFRLAGRGKRASTTCEWIADLALVGQ